MTKLKNQSAFTHTAWFGGEKGGGEGEGEGEGEIEMFNRFGSASVW